MHKFVSVIIVLVAVCWTVIETGYVYWAWPTSKPQAKQALLIGRADSMAYSVSDDTDTDGANDLRYAATMKEQHEEHENDENHSEDKKESKGHKGKKGHKKKHEFGAGKKGTYAEDDHETQFDEHGEHDSSDEHAHKTMHDNHDKKGDKKAGEFDSSKGHKKGHKTTGFHHKYNNDDLKKVHKFYSDEDETGKRKKFGDFLDSYDTHDDKYSKGAHEKKGDDGKQWDEGDEHKNDWYEGDDEEYEDEQGDDEHDEHEKKYGNESEFEEGAEEQEEEQEEEEDDGKDSH